MNNGKNLPKYWNVIILFPVFYAPTINLFPHNPSLPQSTNSRKSESIKFEVNFDKEIHLVFSTQCFHLGGKQSQCFLLRTIETQGEKLPYCLKSEAATLFVPLFSAFVILFIVMLICNSLCKGINLYPSLHYFLSIKLNNVNDIHWDQFQNENVKSIQEKLTFSTVVMLRC